MRVGNSRTWKSFHHDYGRLIEHFSNNVIASHPQPPLYCQYRFALGFAQYLHTSSQPMSSPRSAVLTPPAALTPSKIIIKQDDVHKYRRRFIGPMPATALQQIDSPRKQRRKRHRWHHREDDYSSSDSDSDSDSSSLSDVIHRHALEFFLKHGGKRENWGESQQKSVRAEMRRRWHESEWGRVHTQRQQGSTQKWVGSSFDVGVFLGVDVLDESLFGPPSAELTVVEPPSTPPLVSAPSANAETFVTAKTHLPPTAGPPLLSPDVSAEVDTSNVVSANSSTALLVNSESHPALSEVGPSTAAIAPPSQAQPNGILGLPPPSSNLQPNAGKAREVRVRYETPAPPREVLARSGSAVKATSAGATESATNGAGVKYGDVMRGTS